MIFLRIKLVEAGKMLLLKIGMGGEVERILEMNV